MKKRKKYPFVEYGKLKISYNWWQVTLMVGIWLFILLTFYSRKK